MTEAARRLELNLKLERKLQQHEATASLSDPHLHSLIH